MAETLGLRLSVLPGRLAVCRLDPSSGPPAWARSGPIRAYTWTAHELSVVCAEADVLAGVRHEPGWRALMVAGPLDFGLTGVLAGLAGPLAAVGISLFALSTYDTDYLLVREAALDAAVATLRAAGHAVET